MNCKRDMREYCAGGGEVGGRVGGLAAGTSNNR